MPQRIQQWLDRSKPLLQYSRTMGRDNAGESDDREASRKGPSVFGRWVRETRLALGLTQTKVAELAHVHRIHLCQIETGRVQFPYHDVQLRICRALGRQAPEEVRSASPWGLDRDEPDPSRKREVSPYGLWLRDARRRHRFSQAELSFFSGVHRTIIAYTEAGRTRLPSAKNRKNISAVLTEQPPQSVIAASRRREAMCARCSFCGQPEEDCRHLIASARARRTWICSSCIQGMTALVAVHERKRRLGDGSAPRTMSWSVDSDGPGAR